MVKTALPMQGARLRSLVGELTSHMLQGTAKKLKKKKKKRKTANPSATFCYLSLSLRTKIPRLRLRWMWRASTQTLLGMLIDADFLKGLVFIGSLEVQIL